MTFGDQIKHSRRKTMLPFWRSCKSSWCPQARSSNNNNHRRQRRHRHHEIKEEDKEEREDWDGKNIKPFDRWSPLRNMIIMLRKLCHAIGSGTGRGEEQHQRGGKAKQFTTILFVTVSLIIFGCLCDNVLHQPRAFVRSNFSHIQKGVFIVERPIISQGLDRPIMLRVVEDINGNNNELEIFDFLPPLTFASYEHDYGGLDIYFLGTGGRRRIQPDKEIHNNNHHIYRVPWNDDDVNEDGNDDNHVNKSDLSEKGRPRKCRRASWHHLYRPNCNVLHEVQLGTRGDLSLLGEGAYRSTFLLSERFDLDVVLKVSRYPKQDYVQYIYKYIQTDALVMQKLMASPRIADIFGHCGTSVFSEFLEHEAEPDIIPVNGNIGNLHDEFDVKPQNNFTISEKLDVILQSAESIADLHGFKDGVIVHDDLRWDQYFFTSDGSLKLNDFNRARVMPFDEEDGSYCRHKNGGGNGRHRAPEEYKDEGLNEKIDIWSFGNSIYELLTGLSVFYHAERKKVPDMVINGETAYLDPRYRNRNFIQDNLIRIMELSWTYDVDERPEIFELLKLLRETKAESQRLGIAS